MLSKQLQALLLRPYQLLDKILGVNMDPMMLANLAWIIMIIMAIVLRLLGFRRAAKAAIILGLILLIPPLLLVLGKIIPSNI